MHKLLIPLALMAMALTTACGGDDEADSPEEATARSQAQATIDAAAANADELGVTDQTREYAAQWCDPMESLIEEFTDLEPEFATAEAAEDFTVLGDLVENLVGPLTEFRDDLADMDPPDEYEEFHQAALDEMDYAVRSMEAVQEEGFFAAAFLAGEEPPSAEEPPEMEAALAIECGEQFVELFESDTFGEFFGGEGGEEEDGFGIDFGSGSEEVPCEGAGCSRSDPAPLGASVETSDGQVIRVIDVNLDAETAVLAADDFIEPPEPGNRMVLVEVEVDYEGEGDETVFVQSGQFSLTGSNNVIYDSFDEGVSCGFLNTEINQELFPGGSARGDVCFQYPEGETDLILIVEPFDSFGDESRRYLALE